MVRECVIFILDNFCLFVLRRSQKWCLFNFMVTPSFNFLFLGEDGPSQMGLEDLSLFRAIPNSTVFYPSDAVATEKAVELAANRKVRNSYFLFLKEDVSNLLLNLTPSQHCQNWGCWEL